MANPALDTAGQRDWPSSTSTSEQPTADADSREMMTNAERHTAATIRIELADDEQAQQKEGR